MSNPTQVLLFSEQCVSPLQTCPSAGITNSANKWRMCHVVILLEFLGGLVSFFFYIPGKLWSCWVSRPSISCLVVQIVRQQNLRCPFLVISGESECYHNPSLCLHFSSSLLLFRVNCLSFLCRMMQNLSFMFCNLDYNSIFCTPSSVSVPVTPVSIFF